MDINSLLKRLIIYTPYCVRNTYFDIKKQKFMLKFKSKKSSTRSTLSFLVRAISVPLKHLQSGAEILETWYFLPPPLPLKQCCNNDSMPPGLLKWSTQHCLWGMGGNK